MVPDVTERAVWDAVHPGTRSALLAQAEAELAHATPSLPASAWATVFREGTGTTGEDTGRLREQVTLFVLAAVLTDEVAPATAPPGATPYLDAAISGLVSLAEARTWRWLPQEESTTAPDAVLPVPEEPFVDLGAAEVTSLFAWADHVLGPHLDIRAPGLRQLLRREVNIRVLTPFEHTRDWHWMGPDGDAHNWNPWIYGAILAAALLLVDDEGRRARLLRLVTDGLDHYLDTLPDDGGVGEGVAHWWHGACRLLEALDLLGEAGAPDERHLPVLGELIRFPHRMHLGGDWYVNPGTTPARLPAGEPWHVLHRWGERFGDEDVRAHAVSRGRQAEMIVRPETGLGPALAGLADSSWRHPAPVTPESWLPREVWLPRVQVLIAREMAGTAEGLTLAVKAGHNGEGQNHLDVGSYWVVLDGVPVVVDVGRPIYSPVSFGQDSEPHWPAASEWHNVPEPGARQQPGSEHRARDVRAELGADEVELHADLAGAYPAGLLDHWWRTARLVRHPAEVVIEERWSPRRGLPVLLRHVLSGEVELGDGWALVRSAATLRITWHGATAELDQRRLDDPLLRRSWGDKLSRLTLRVPDTGSFTVRMSRA